MKKPYNDFAPRNGSRNDYLSILAMVVGIVGLMTFLWWAGVIVDSIISLLELV